jgi:hypothetical protein
MKYSGLQADGTYYCVCCTHWKRVRWAWLLYGVAAGIVLGTLIQTLLR